MVWPEPEIPGSLFAAAKVAGINPPQLGIMYSIVHWVLGLRESKRGRTDFGGFRFPDECKFVMTRNGDDCKFFWGPAARPALRESEFAIYMLLPKHVLDGHVAAETDKAITSALKAGPIDGPN